MVEVAACVGQQNSTAEQGMTSVPEIVLLQRLLTKMSDDASGGVLLLVAVTAAVDGQGVASGLCR